MKRDSGVLIRRFFLVDEEGLSRELGVKSVRFEKFFMGSLLDNCSSVEDINAVGIANR